MKKIFFILGVSILIAGLAACSEESTENVNDPVIASFSMRIFGGNVLVNLPEESYEVSIPENASSWIHVNQSQSSGKALVLEVDENQTNVERSAVVAVTQKGRNSLLASVIIAQSNLSLRPGEFVIEEIYFTGTALAESGSPDKYQGDQYLKIRNNTDEDLYADGMMLILSSGLISGQNSELYPGADFRAECCASNAIYCIPGSGHDVLVKAGESLIVVNNAQNHTTANPDSWDATKAHFEWFDLSSNDKFLDIDNPGVSNLDKWYASTLTVHTLHNRGFNAIAIAMPSVGLTSEQFLAQYPLIDAYYLFHSPNGSDYKMPLKNCYRVPNDWILDAVNTGCRDAYFLAPWDASLDAGYAWCGTTNPDPERFGKSVIRKTGSNGKLVDTNNSTNDFDSNTTASMLKK